MISFLGRLAAAIRFLTVFPLPGKLGTTTEELASSIGFFPLTGALIGCVAALAAFLLQLFLPPLVSAVLLVCLLAACSSALHLDGLADTADGFFSSRPQQRILEIMRDSATGAMGVIVLVLVLLCKTACLGTMDFSRLSAAVFLMPLAGRVAILLLMALQPYARSEGGLATLFYAKSTKRSAVFGTLFFALFAFSFAGLRGGVTVLAVVMLSFVFGRYCRRRIGGATGDTLGAVSELAETMVALVFAGGLA